MSNKVRIIPTVLIDGWKIIKTIGFKTIRNVGSPTQVFKLYNYRRVDELIILDIFAKRQNRPPSYDYLKRMCALCLGLPLSIGGGVSGLKEAVQLLELGADRIILNSLLFDNPKMVTELEHNIGAQSVIASIDFIKTEKGFRVFSHHDQVITEKDPYEFCKLVADLGAGEIMLGSVDCDGTLRGYEIDFIGEISDKLKIPVIANGGASGLEDFLNFKNKFPSISGLAASSLFLYTENTPRMVSRHLTQNDINARVVEFE